MKHGFRKINKWGLGLFFTAAFLGLGIILISFLLDSGASFHRSINVNTIGGSAPVSNIQGEQNLYSLKCPLVITPQDHASIKVKVTNPLDRTISRLFEISISRGYFQEISKEVIDMEPGQVTELSWDISAEDARYDSRILARAFLHSKSSLPSRSGTCGILVLDVPWISGSQLIWGIIGLCAVGMGTGTTLFHRQNRSISRRQAKWVISLLIVAGTVMAGLLLTFFEYLLGSFMITLIAFLIVPAVFRDLVIKS